VVEGSNPFEPVCYCIKRIALHDKRNPTEGNIFLLYIMYNIAYSGESDQKADIILVLEEFA
jgi:hypothetical protein